MLPSPRRVSISATDKAGTEQGGQRTVLADQAELPGALALQSALQVHGDIGLALLLQAVLRAWKIKGAGGGEQVCNSALHIGKPHPGEQLELASQGPASQDGGVQLSPTILFTRLVGLLAGVFPVSLPSNQLRGK